MKKLCDLLIVKRICKDIVLILINIANFILKTFIICYLSAQTSQIFFVSHEIIYLFK